MGHQNDPNLDCKVAEALGIKCIIENNVALALDEDFADDWNEDDIINDYQRKFYEKYGHHPYAYERLPEYSTLKENALDALEEFCDKNMLGFAIWKVPLISSFQLHTYNVVLNSQVRQIEYNQNHAKSHMGKDDSIARAICLAIVSAYESFKKEMK